MSIFNKSKPEVTVNSNIMFRIIFVSQFFQLEVKCGSGGWQTVHSQNGKPNDNVSANLISYPLLRFLSFQSALLYANETLGLFVMSKGGPFGMFSSPPASFMRSEDGVDSVNPRKSTVLASNTEIL